MGIIRQKEVAIEGRLISQLGVESFMPGLARVSSFLSGSLDLMKNGNFKVATIGGTNGKGETALFLNELLAKEGISACVWSSPHISSIRERFCYGSELISYELLETLIEEVFEEIRVKDICLSYYEFLFAVFLKFCLVKEPDVIVLEVGLGGRFDAVNLIDSDICAITSISRDHQAILGDSYKEILHEKLGITREGTPLVSSFMLNYLFERTKSYCEKQKTPYFDLISSNLINRSDNYSVRNRKLALQIFYFFYRKDYFLKKEYCGKCSLLSIELNREEKVTIGNRTFIFIGAHNVDGMRSFVDRDVVCDDLIVAFSSRSDKDIKTSLKILNQKFDRISLTTFNHSKACDSEKLISLGFNLSVPFEKIIESRLEKDGLTAIIGSYYFIGEVKKYFENKSYI